MLVILCMNLSLITCCQGITLLSKGGRSADWNAPTNWIQINTAPGQIPIQRVPTELDDVVIDSTLSGVPLVTFLIDSFIIHVGGNVSTGYRCRSLHISNTTVSFDFPGVSGFTPELDVYTSGGGYVLIDSASNLEHGVLSLFGGNPAITDLQIINSIGWPIAIPIDTLVINKTGCAKVTFGNSVYVAGQAKIKIRSTLVRPK